MNTIEKLMLAAEGYEEECIRILREEPRGVLSLMGDDGYPYGIPMDQWYCEEDGCLYFHCAKEGHKMDAIARCDKVSFCVFDQGYRREGEWALNIRSVIVFGRVQVLEDPEVSIAIVRKLGAKYTTDTEYIHKTVRQSAPNLRILRLTPEHITGKLVNES